MCLLLRWTCRCGEGGVLEDDVLPRWLYAGCVLFVQVCHEAVVSAIGARVVGLSRVCAGSTADFMMLQET